MKRKMKDLVGMEEEKWKKGRKLGKLKVVKNRSDLPSIAVLGIDIATKFDEEFDDLEMTGAYGIV